MTGRALFLLPRSPDGRRIGRDLMGGYGMEVSERLVYPPTSSIWLATLLRERGYDVRVHEEDHEGPASPADAQGPFDLVFVHVAQPCWSSDLATATRFTKARVVFHGSLVRERPELALTRHPRSWVVASEEEGVIAAFPHAEQLAATDAPPAGCAAMVDGKVERGPVVEALPLTSLPLPDRTLVCAERYRLPHLEGPLATTFHSRGCPFDCSFCGYVRTQGTAMRYRKPEDVAAEFEALREQGYARVVFRDAIFSVHRTRTLALLDALRPLGTALPWQCETAPRCLDLELLEAMARAGCEHVSLGIESPDAHVQSEHCGEKLPERSHIVCLLRTARRLGIATRGFFMLGFPGETRAMMRDTGRYARGLAFDSVQFCAVTQHPGTRLSSDRAGDEVLQADARRYACEGNGVLAAAEIDAEIRRAYRLYYLHPRRWWPLITRPGLVLQRWARYRSIARRS